MTQQLPALPLDMRGAPDSQRAGAIACINITWACTFAAQVWVFHCLGCHPSALRGKRGRVDEVWKQHAPLVGSDFAPYHMHESTRHCDLQQLYRVLCVCALNHVSEGTVVLQPLSWRHLRVLCAAANSCMRCSGVEGALFACAGRLRQLRAIPRVRVQPQGVCRHERGCFR